MLLIPFNSHSTAAQCSTANMPSASQFQTEAGFNFDTLFPSNNNRAALTDSGMRGFVFPASQ